MVTATSRRPNILFIMSDDHAAHAISCYGSRINQTPNIDRIAAGGMRLDNCLCTNSICAPSRATILTGLYSHLNGVETLDDKFDGRQPNVAKQLQAAGYQTAIVGKWHLGHGGEHDPTGFDYWNVLPGQGAYHDPVLIEGGERKQHQGYVTDIITDLSLDWLRRRDPERPFFLLCHHKAPHRPWEPDAKHAQMYEDIDIPEPATFDDDYSERSAAAAAAKMRIDRDLTERDLKQPPPDGLSPEALKRWKYQRYIKDYLRCVASIDDNVGRLLDYLDETGLAEETIVIYTSDQGFFLGDHGWYDKRFFYEESLRMPFLIRYPKEIAAGSSDDHIVLNVDFAPLWLDYAGLSVPTAMQGRSFRPMLRKEAPGDWRTSMYYRYFMHLAHHNVYAHYGVRTDRYKLIYYYKTEPAPPEWELFDLEHDPCELHNRYHDPAYADQVAALKRELLRLREEVGDVSEPWDEAVSGTQAGP
ncbi:MAG TPA: sulfatase [Limnochordia bacterium]|nr:sulfatase [Limnochordia bacterium]